MISDSMFVHNVPKLVLHTHLEGSIPRNVLFEIANRNDIKLRFDYKTPGIASWSSFLEKYFEICSCLLASVDFEEAIIAYAGQLARNRVAYAELHLTPFIHLRRGITYEQLAVAIRNGVATSRNRFGIVLKFILDLIRIPGEDHESMLDWMSDIRADVVAVGFSGDDSGRPYVEYKQYCKKVKQAGFKIVAHAGELSGASSVEMAVTFLNVDRISHGVRVLEDLDLFQRMVAKQIHFELCPTSNLILNVTGPNYSNIKRIIESGANFSINPDDELIFCTDIVKEMLAMVHSNIMDREAIKKSILDSIGASFAEHEIKDELHGALFNYINEVDCDTYN